LLPYISSPFPKLLGTITSTQAGKREPSVSERRRRQFGARASRLLKLLEEGHEGVKLPDEDLYRLTLRLDCNSGFFGGYENIDDQAAGKIVLPKLE
jgi:hypothetical protein